MICWNVLDRYLRTMITLLLALLTILQSQKMQLKYYPFLKVGFVYQYDGDFGYPIFGLPVVRLFKYSKLSSIYVLALISSDSIKLFSITERQGM